MYDGGMKERVLARRIAGGAVLGAALALGAVSLAGSGPAQTGPERGAAALAFAAVVGAPGLLALSGDRRPGRVLAAGIGLVPVALASSAGVTLPLLVPAIVLAVLAWRDRPPTIRAGAAALIAVVGLSAAIAALIVHEDPRSWTTFAGRTTIADGYETRGGGLPSGARGGSSSDVITLAESTGSLALVALTLAAAVALTAPEITPASRGAGLAAGRATPRR
jgi:hypothetical protein